MFIVHALTNTFNYSGRTRRKDFWLWTLTVGIFILAWFNFVLVPLQHTESASNFELMRILVGFPAVLLIPSVPLMIRRVRDAGHGPKILLWLFAPAVVLPIAFLNSLGSFLLAFVLFCVLELIVGAWLLIVFCKPSKTY